MVKRAYVHITKKSILYIWMETKFLKMTAKIKFLFTQLILSMSYGARNICMWCRLTLRFFVGSDNLILNFTFYEFYKHE